MKFTLCFMVSAILLWANIMQAQVLGCRDMNASNYNPAATKNDGSCLYATTNYRLTLITNLSDTLNETSGLGMIAGNYVSQNDGGNGNLLHIINPINGNIMRSIVLANCNNYDWEALAYTNDKLFIGDFGNNYGNRQNLVIYGCNAIDLANSSQSTVNCEPHTYVYSNQSSFVSALNNNDFDAEAFYNHQDTFHIFTKNWVNNKTNHYALPNDTSQHLALLIDSFDCDGLITDCSHDSNTNTTVLLGYKPVGLGLYNSFAWLITDYEDGNIFGGNKRRIELGSALQVGQTEGIYLNANGTGVISAERINQINAPARLFYFDFSPYLPKYATTTEPVDHSFRLVVKNNPVDSLLGIELHGSKSDATFVILSVYGLDVLSGTLKPGLNTLDITSLKAGVYFLTVNGRTKKTVKLVKI